LVRGGRQLHASCDHRALLIAVVLANPDPESSGVVHEPLRCKPISDDGLAEIVVLSIDMMSTGTNRQTVSLRGLPLGL
jgi:hypothetical protein